MLPGNNPDTFCNIIEIKQFMIMTNAPKRNALEDPALDWFGGFVSLKLCRVLNCCFDVKNQNITKLSFLSM